VSSSPTSTPRRPGASDILIGGDDSAERHAPFRKVNERSVVVQGRHMFGAESIWV
jgi:hypothetical protein